jgi:hypothetical protein
MHHIDIAHIILASLLLATILLCIRFKDIAKRNTRRLKHYRAQLSEQAHLARLEEYRNSPVKRRYAYFTSLTGGYESFKVPEYFDPTFDYYIFTDDEDLKVFEPFKKVLIGKPGDDPVRLSRRVKLNPFEMLPGYEYAVWVDASFLVRNSLEPYVSKVQRAEADLGVFPHPDRSRYEEEAEACIRKGKDSREIIAAQLECYTAGHDIAAINAQPLLAMGVFIANLKSETCRRFFNAWRREYYRFSRRDQLAAPFALNEARPRYVFLESTADLAHQHNKYMFEIYNHSTQAGYATPDYLPETGEVIRLPEFVDEDGAPDAEQR